MLNILNKDFFKTDIGKEIARKYFGYRYDEDEKKPRRIQVASKTILQEIAVKQQTPLQHAPIVKPAEETLEETVVEKPDFERMFGDEREKLTELSKQIEEAEAGLATKYTMQLYDFARHCKNKGVIGEEGLVCNIGLSAVNGSSFVVLGYSGSGKTFVTDKIVDLLSDVYTLSLSSNTAIFNDADEINKSRFIYIPELQKAMKNKKSTVIEAIKDLTEGKDASRIVTSKKGKGVTKYSIQKGKSILATLAAENDFEMDKESARRLIHFRTDSSQEHLDEIHDSKAKKRYTLRGSEKTAKQLENRLKEHMDECMNLDVNIIDPFSEYIISNMVPKTQKSVGYIDHYYSLLDGCAKFHFNQRTKLDIDGETYLLINLEDHFNVFKMYFHEFMQTLKDLAKDDEESLKELEIISEPDWKQCFEEGCKVIMESPELELLREDYSNELKEWYSSQTDSGRIHTKDYKTGKTIMIVEGVYNPIRGGDSNETI